MNLYDTPSVLSDDDAALARVAAHAASLRWLRANDPGDPAVEAEVASTVESGETVILPTGYPAVVVVVDGGRVLCRIANTAAWFTLDELSL